MTDEQKAALDALDRAQRAPDNKGRPMILIFEDRGWTIVTAAWTVGSTDPNERVTMDRFLKRVRSVAGVPDIVDLRAMDPDAT